MCLINNCNGKSYIGSFIGETGRLLKFRINEHLFILYELTVDRVCMHC